MEHATNDTSETDALEQEKRDELNARLDAANAKAESARLDREALETSGELERKVVAAERAASDERALYEAEAEHGARKIGTVATDLGLIIVKRANPILFKRFQDSESVKTEDLEKLVRPCVVHPTMREYDAIIEELPAALVRVADRVMYLAGVRAKDTGGK